jgi:hypothetical protein
MVSMQDTTAQEKEANIKQSDKQRAVGQQQRRTPTPKNTPGMVAGRLSPVNSETSRQRLSSSALKRNKNKELEQARIALARKLGYSQ